MLRKHSIVQSYKVLLVLIPGQFSLTHDFFNAITEASGVGSLLMIFEVCPSGLNVR